MRTLALSGIYPPDIGGPATHVSDLLTEFPKRGHSVEVVTLTDQTSVSRGAVTRFPRRWPWPVRTAAVIAEVVRRRSKTDVIYSTGLAPAAMVAAAIARRPLVVKIVGDPAWERGRRQGLHETGFDEFQQRPPVGLRDRAMQTVRNATVRRADRVVVPSEYLRDVVQGWTGRDDIVVVPNGVKPVDAPAPHTADGQVRLLFVGRLVDHKHVDMILRAVAGLEGISIDIVGDGPERESLQNLAASLGIDQVVRFTSSLSHDEVLAMMHRADALVLNSSYEGLPHVVIEALACATPVISSCAGGVDEVIEDRISGLLYDRPDVDDLLRVLKEFSADPSLRLRLRSGAETAGRAWRFDRTLDRLEAVMTDLVSDTRPRAAFVGKTRLNPDKPDVKEKFELHSALLDQLQINVGPYGERRIGGVRLRTIPASGPIGSALFYIVAPIWAVLAVSGRNPGAVVAKSPYEGFSAAVFRSLIPRPWRPKLMIELHGDWEAAARLYGGRIRRMLGTPSDAVAKWAVRRADRLRVVSDNLEGAARRAGYTGPIDKHIAFSSYGSFLEHDRVPVPDEPVVAFVGVLEPYKAIDVLMSAWERTLAAIPEARLLMVGASGSLLDETTEIAARPELHGSIELVPPVDQHRLAALMDQARFLVLPSRSEGLPRVVLEAMARGRGVVATRVGGIDEFLTDGFNGNLLEVGDVDGLTECLIGLLGDRDRCETYGRNARAVADERQPTDEYIEGMRRTAAWIAAR